MDPVMCSETELLELASRIRFDLVSAGFAPVPDGREDGPEGGLFIDIDKGKVIVAWQVHARLGDAALDMQEAGRSREAVVQQLEAAKATMHLALGSLLTAFGYRIHVPVFGYALEITAEPG